MRQSLNQWDMIYYMNFWKYNPDSFNISYQKIHIITGYDNMNLMCLFRDTGSIIMVVILNIYGYLAYDNRSYEII